MGSGARQGRINEDKRCPRRPFVHSSSCRGSVGKQRCPRPINRHASTKAAGFWGPWRSALDLWARGLLSASWEWGSPDLPDCGPRRGWASRSVWPIFIDKAFKTLARGQASRAGRCKTSSGAASPGRLARGGEIKAGETSRGPHDVSHDDRDQASARRALARVVSFFPLWCQGGKRRRGVRRYQQRFPYWCNETETRRIAGRRSPWIPRRRHHQSLWQANTTFC